MPILSGKPLLLGRDGDIAELDEVLGLAAQGTPQVVLVGGDAGIGKTTLVADVERRATELGFTVATGHCLDIEAGISFAPVVEAVRALLAGLDDLQTRPSARRMLTLLDPDAPRSRETLRLLDDLTAAVLEAAAAGPVLMVLEDMHWADRSTQDFAATLSRIARGGLLLVLTFRSDELHRRHPFRKTVAEISRTPGARRIDLAGLDRDDIAGIVAACTDGPPDPSTVDSVLARSEGNPLYAEELLAANQEGVPDHLTDLLLARIDALDDGPRTILRVASVNGTRLDTATLAELAGLDQTRTERYLREALDANVLRQTGDSLQFRHPLLREAAYDDLMPDERTRIHGRLAEILQARVDAEPDPGLATLSRLAYHWNAAHDPPRTLAASVRAALVARRVCAAEELAHLERALSLWDRVPDAEARAGRPRIEVVVLLGEAAGYQGDDEGWHTHTRRAVDMLEPDTNPLLASRAYSALGFCAFFNKDTIGADEAIRRAVEYAGDAPTRELAWALAAQAQLHTRNDRHTAALHAAERAIESARTPECIEPLLKALNTQAVSLGYLGRFGESCATGEQVVEVARSAGMVGQALGMAAWLAGQLVEAGQVDRGKSVARETYDEALAAGLLYVATICADPLVTALAWDGSLDEAELVLKEVRGLGPTDDIWRCQAELFLARGNTEAAASVMPETAVGDVTADVHPDEYDVLREVRLADLRDDGARCHELAATYLTQLEESDSPLIAAAAARIGFQALNAERFADAVQAERLGDLAARQLEQARAGLTDEWRSGFHGVQLALAEAYAARGADEPAVEQFRKAASLGAPFGAYFALEPRLNLAEELLTHGGRDEGRELLVDCWNAAHDMGAHDLERRALRLATRTRVPLPNAASREGPLSRLTPREREVLDLLATGATNKTIAADLFISEKTVSVHISNLLGKLGVANRGAAAALARDLVD